MNVEVIDGFSSKHTDEFRALYDQYPWWEGRTPKDIQTMIEHTDLLVGLRDTENDQLVAAGRVLTDFVYYAKIYDVIVGENHRGNGLGRKLIESIVEHSALNSVSNMTLDCREGLIPFYEHCGFERHEMEVGLREESEDPEKREDLIPMVYQRE